MSSDKRPEERKLGKSASKTANLFAEKMDLPENSGSMKTDYRDGPVLVWLEPNGR